MRVTIKTKNFLGLLVFFAIATLPVSGVKVYEPWSQVSALWDSGQTLRSLSAHFHFERFLASYPGLVLEEVLPGMGFGLYVALIAAINTVLFRSIYLGLTGRRPSLLIYLIFLAAHLAMNGRGALGWCGWLLCVHLHTIATVKLFTPRNTGQMALSALLASVSSGVFAVTLAGISWLIFTRIRPNFRIRYSEILPTIFSLSALVVVSIVAVRYLTDALTKIYLFFGSYSEIVYHGVGIIVSRIDPLVAILATVALVMALGIIAPAFRGRVRREVWPPLIIACVGGAFGFTTLTLSIPILLIVIGSILPRLNFARQQPYFAPHPLSRSRQSWIR